MWACRAIGIEFKHIKNCDMHALSLFVDKNKYNTNCVLVCSTTIDIQQGIELWEQKGSDCSNVGSKL